MLLFGLGCLDYCVLPSSAASRRSTARWPSKATLRAGARWSTSEHDTLHFEDVLDPCNTSRDVYADKGYVNGKREAQLKGKGWPMHIQRKGSKTGAEGNEMAGKMA